MTKIRDERFIKAFGKNLRSLRIKAKLSQEDLANSADIPINQIGRIERGEINSTISSIKAIASAFGITPKELFEF